MADLNDLYDRVDAGRTDLIQVLFEIRRHDGAVYRAWICEDPQHNEPPAELKLEGPNGEFLRAHVVDVRLWRRKP